MPLSSSVADARDARAAELFNGTGPGRYVPLRRVCALGAPQLGGAFISRPITIGDESPARRSEPHGRARDLYHGI